MTINFANALGIHTSALEYRARRSEVIANNLVNADTPGYKARDMKFADVLANVESSQVKLRTTRAGHMNGRLESLNSELKYRTPLQPSLDGNTVDPELEETNFMRNAIEFQTSFTFLSSKFRGLSNAIRGQQG
jgi:flagellar basal-body rod protein FlgB